MSENSKIYIAVLIKNIICLALWIVLAIVFNKWWIALFSVVSVTSIKSNDNKETNE